ncbi:MAG: aminopeptidase P family protein, partial [Coriobacteriia bacterium]|nr:aminopeptidase P family protein [Coriobacteriia bacterium]
MSALDQSTSDQGEFDLSSRIKQLRSRMRDHNVDAFLALRSLSVQYLTGFEHIADAGDPHAVLVTQDTLRFMTDARYFEVAQRQAQQQTGSELWTVDDLADKSLLAQCAETWNLAAFEHIALEDTVSYRTFSATAALLADTTVLPAKKWVEDIRRTKDSGELQRIATAAQIADLAFPHICDYIRPGISERAVAIELELTLRRLGADGLAFPCIVASGANASFPHAVPSERLLAAGDLLTLDFGVSYQGYCSDMTRTVFVGGGGVRPTDRQQHIYETVRHAQEAGLAAIRAGVAGNIVDAAARSIIADAGFGQYFIHGLGHGVGMQVHEL